MHIHSHFSPGDTHVELYCCQAWRGRFAAAAKASTYFLNRQIVQAATNASLHRKFLEGLDVLELLAYVPAEPLRITPLEAFLAFHLLCTVARHADIDGRHGRNLMLALIALSEATPCTIDDYELPPLNHVAPKASFDVAATYELIRQWPSYCPPHLRLYAAYLLARELRGYRGGNAEVVRLANELDTLSEMLATTLTILKINTPS